MTCPACAEAEANPRTGRFISGCQECASRALASSPEHHAARMVGRFTPEYTAALVALAGPEVKDREAVHARVKAWFVRIEK